jgi:hypothetical protein
MRDAVRWSKMPRNPVDAADPPRAIGFDREMKVWAARDLKKFLTAEKESPVYPLWLTMATTGMRRGEALGLTWEDIDLEAGCLSVKKTRIMNSKLPQELAFRESRLKKIREAKAALEEEARREAEEEAHRQEERIKEREQKEAARGRKFGGRPPRTPEQAKATPKPTKQKNFTDPESCLLKDGATGGFIQAYNAQVAVDEAHEVIVACTLSAQPSAAAGFLPLLAETETQLGRLPEKVSADTGFYSHANLLEAEARPLDCYIPPPRPVSDSLSATGVGRN